MNDQVGYKKIERNGRFVEFFIWIIVGIMPLYLHLYEVVSKILYVLWKSSEKILIIAGVFRHAMFERAINLLPSRLASTRSHSTNKSVCAAFS